MRASFRSRSRDAIWDPVDGKEPDGIWPQNAKRLSEAGLDPYEIWIDRCRYHESDRKTDLRGDPLAGMEGAEDDNV